MSNKIKKVTALFDYIRRHNDELSFNKNDIITLTQQIEGGWWEGTLDQVTGWFPSNYVTEIAEDMSNSSQSESKSSSDSHLLNFQADIVNHILDGEKKYCSKLLHMLNSFLVPLIKLKDLNETKIQRLCDILQLILPLHKQLIESLEEMKFSGKNRVGRLYLEMGSKINETYSSYASVHLFVIYSLELNKSAVQSFFDAQRISFEWSQVKQQLSLVFDRMSRYPLLLKEMERYLEDGNPDRGDVQRAIVFYTDMNDNCNVIRKRKDRDLDILCANILGWKGERLSQLGDPILTMKASYVSPSGPIDLNAILNHVVVVMPSCLLLLACTEQADVYTFKSKLPIENLTVFCNNENSGLEIRSELTGEYLHLFCDSPESRNELNLAIKQASVDQSEQLQGSNNNSCTDSPSAVVSLVSDSRPTIGNLTAADSKDGIDGDSHQMPNNVLRNPGSSDLDVSGQHRDFSYLYKPSCEQLRILRPDPPAPANMISCSQQVPVMRSTSGAGGHFSPKAARRKKEDRLKSAINSDEVLKMMTNLKEPSSRIKDDALVLQVIESYCVTNKSNSLDLARLRLSDAEIIRTSNNWPNNENSVSHVSKQVKSHLQESIRGRESSSSSNTTASGDNCNVFNRRIETMAPCQLNIRGHERGGCSCIAQAVSTKPVGCAPMISGRNKKKS